MITIDKDGRMSVEGKAIEVCADLAEIVRGVQFALEAGGIERTLAKIMIRAAFHTGITKAEEKSDEKDC